MADATITLEQVLDLARRLTPLDKVRLIKGVVPDLEAPLSAVADAHLPLQSAYGICADLGPAPSAADIDEVRQEPFGSSQGKSLEFSPVLLS